MVTEIAPRVLVCLACGGNPIDAPTGSTLHTRFLCRKCCARISRRKSIAEGLAFGVEQRTKDEDNRRRAALRRALIADPCQKQVISAHPQS